MPMVSTLWSSSTFPSTRPSMVRSSLAVSSPLMIIECPMVPMPCSIALIPPGSPLALVSAFGALLFTGKTLSQETPATFASLAIGIARKRRSSNRAYLVSENKCLMTRPYTPKGPQEVAFDDALAWPERGVIESELSCLPSATARSCARAAAPAGHLCVVAGTGAVRSRSDLGYGGRVHRDPSAARNQLNGARPLSRGGSGLPALGQREVVRQLRMTSSRRPLRRRQH